MANRFNDNQASGTLSAANLNSLDRGGNVYASAAGGLKVDISPCRIVDLNAASLVDYAGETEKLLTANQTNYIYILMSSPGAVTVSTSGFPASFSATPYIPLAEVVCGAAAITSITDKRPSFFVP